MCLGAIGRLNYAADDTSSTFGPLATCTVHSVSLPNTHSSTRFQLCDPLLHLRHPSQQHVQLVFFILQL